MFGALPHPLTIESRKYQVKGKMYVSECLALSDDKIDANTKYELALLKQSSYKSQASSQAACYLTHHQHFSYMIIPFTFSSLEFQDTILSYFSSTVLLVSYV